MCFASTHRSVKGFIPQHGNKNAEEKHLASSLENAKACYRDLALFNITREEGTHRDGFLSYLFLFSSWWVSQTQSHNEHHAPLSATPAPISEIEHCLAGGCKATHLSAIDHIRNITSEFQKINISARRFFYV